MAIKHKKADSKEDLPFYVYKISIYEENNKMVIKMLIVRNTLGWRSSGISR
ncbi:hypothetical protein J2S14_000059 [Lederbergia wuyishanensis]|uniref:Uncharacterized protein n=1 Tax=Lederbergia wuyishanensis TaxID=1347903 RepID=A0ABU0CYN3_9BACI|nr:hypothetical protein [Lederbergia wuyishanensis]